MAPLEQARGSRQQIILPQRDLVRMNVECLGEFRQRPVALQLLSASVLFSWSWFLPSASILEAIFRQKLRSSYYPGFWGLLSVPE